MNGKRLTILTTVIILLLTISTINHYNPSSLADQQSTGNKLGSSSIMPLMKGMTVNAWSAEAYNSSDFDQSITNLANINASWALFTIFWFMEYYYDTEMHRRLDLYTASDSSLIHAIQKARELNMKVALKPMVDVVDGTWRGQISPSNWTLWFQNYRNFINFYADLAEENGVDLFVVGTEFRSSQSYESEWRNVISEVRTFFSKNITYAANWDSYRISHIGFWDALDYVGVDAYFPLTNSYNPTFSQLTSAWSYCTRSGYVGRNWTNELYSTHIATGREIIFTEIGYCSQDGTNTKPWDWNISPTVDLQEQADCYKAALEVFKEESWFEGWFWWNWETDPDEGGPADAHFTPQNKPAQSILNQYYRYDVPPDFAVTNVTCSETLVEKGTTVNINVTVENQGTYTETLNVTAYANSTTIQTNQSTVEKESVVLIVFAWNTSGFAEGNYTVKAYVWPHPFEVDTSDNTFIDGSVLVTTMNDVAVIDICLSRTTIGQGGLLDMNITVENQGYYAETLNITCYANATIINTLENIFLEAGSAINVTFVWNTTDFDKGAYSIRSYAWPVPGETDVEDNTFVDGWVMVTFTGDINGDGKVNILDAILLSSAFGSEPGDLNWKPNADFNADDKINILDAILLSTFFSSEMN